MTDMENEAPDSGDAAPGACPQGAQAAEVAQGAQPALRHFLLRASGGVALAQAALKALGEHPGEWDRFTARQEWPGSPHAGTRTIPLRYLAWPLVDPKRVFNDLQVVAWPLLQWRLEFQLLLAQLQPHLPGPIARAVVVELAPGGAVAPHVDEGLYSSVTLRHHFVLATNPGAVMWVGHDEASGEALHMAQGELWTINKDEVHGAVNQGTEPRVHIILDTWKNGVGR